MKRFSVILMAGALLEGCVSMTAPSQQSAGTYHAEASGQRQSQQLAIKSWTATGAISIQQAQQSPLIMRYDWQQWSSDHYRINLAASLNLAAVTITGQPGRVTLQKGDEPPISAPTPEQLMKKGLGWSLPVSSLWYWARGVPAPGATQGTKYDKFGHLIWLSQGGWQVNYAQYHTVQSVDLPSVIELHGPNLSAKIVVKQWVINKAG